LNTLLTVDEITEAMKRNPPQDDFSWSQVRLGVDVARFGDDETAIVARQGLMSWPSVTLRGARTPEIAGRVLQESAKYGAEVIFVDDTGGWGAGVVDALLQAGANVIPVNFAGKAQDPRYYNCRAEMWFRLAEWVKRGGALGEDSLLAAELSAPVYSVRDGKFWLEDKDQVKKRLRRSPDRADALALTFALPDLPSKAGGAFLEHGGQDKTQRAERREHPFQVRTLQPIRRDGEEADYNPISDQWLYR
jgi:hypothetical protein